MTRPLLALAALGWLLGLSGCEVLPDSSSLRPGTAILYGVGTYSDTEIAKLQGPPNDVDDLNATFVQQGWTTLVRKDSAAKLSTGGTNLTSDIQTIAASTKPFDRVFLYFSGHGTSLSKSSGLPGEWVIFDDGIINISPGANQFVLSGLLNASRLATLIQPLLDKKALVIVVLDTCYSGALVPDYLYINGLPYNYAEINSPYSMSDPYGGALSQSITAYFSGTSPDSQGRPLGASNLWVIAASGPQEVSLEVKFSDQRWNGIFTRFFTQSRKYGDANGDGVVTVFEAYRYTKQALHDQWDTGVSDPSQDYEYLPHMSGSPYDTPLFTR